MTSVTIPDELRKKLKRLAAKYDTSQAEIIRKSLEIFEKYEQDAENMPSEQEHWLDKMPISESRRKYLKEYLAKITAEFEEKYPDVAKSLEKLRNNPQIIEEATIGNWDLPFEE